ncbi:MAPEG family protein [Rheinheimera marina]|uniref:MAPEG family protein n=1 Tax=Rheinheimera marina TaxID=1774958 RepID=A0ABV9JRR1_9GAMM
MDKWLFGSVLVQVLLTLAVMVLMGRRRFASARNKEISLKAFRTMDLAGANEGVITASRNFDNQFQLPVLYLAAVALTLPAGLAELPLVLLGWCFVVSRVAHCLVHTGSNNVRLRFSLYLLGAVFLLLYWVRLSALVLLA